MYNTQTELLFHFKQNNLFSYYLMQGFNDLIEEKNNDKQGQALLQYALVHELDYLPKASFNLEFIDKLFIPINGLNMVHFINVLDILQKDKKQEVFQALTFNALIYSAIDDKYTQEAHVYLNRLLFLLERKLFNHMSSMNQLIIKTLLEHTQTHRKKIEALTYEDLFPHYTEDEVMTVATYFPAFGKCFRQYLNLENPEQKRKMIEQDIMIEIEQGHLYVKQII